MPGYYIPKCYVFEQLDIKNNIVFNSLKILFYSKEMCLTEYHAFTTGNFHNMHSQ